MNLTQEPKIGFWTENQNGLSQATSFRSHVFQQQVMVPVRFNTMLETKDDQHILLV